MAALCQGNLAALLASSQALIGGCQTMQGVLLAFLQSRAKEALAAGQRLAECGSPQSALEIQLDFAREALQAYADQFHTLGRITSEALDDCSRPLKRAAPGAARPARRASPPEPRPGQSDRGGARDRMIRPATQPASAAPPAAARGVLRWPNRPHPPDRATRATSAAVAAARRRRAAPDHPAQRSSVGGGSCAAGPAAAQARARQGGEAAQPAVQQPAVTPTTNPRASVRSRRERAGSSSAATPAQAAADQPAPAPAGAAEATAAP